MNLKTEEFTAIGDMLGDLKFEIGVEEYKNDLVQPQFAAVAGVAPSSSTAMAPMMSSKPDPDGPPTDIQWQKCNKMAAWLGL